MTRGMKTSEFWLVALAWVFAVAMLVLSNIGAISGQAAILARQFGADGSLALPIFWAILRQVFKMLETKYMSQAPALPSVIPAPDALPPSALPIQ